jgi:hypothetical protein
VRLHDRIVSFLHGHLGVFTPEDMFTESMVCNRMGDYLVLPFQGADDFSHKTVDLYIETVDLYTSKQSDVEYINDE